jgi:hypothetical protein
MPRKREAWEIEAQATKNVAEAIERFLHMLPAGSSRSVEQMWEPISGTGVSREIFDRAVWTLQQGQRIRKIKDRLYPPARRR